MTLFHLYAAYDIVPTQPLRYTHVAFVLVLCFLLFPLAARFRNRIQPWDVVAAAASVAILAYAIWGGEDFTDRATGPLQLDVVLGVIFIVLLMEATRRTSGWIMPAVALLFIAYAMLGPYLPPPWTHRGYTFSRLVGHLFITLEGIFGVAVDVSSSLIILFTIYGAFLQHSGAGKFFIDFSLALMGGKPNSAGRTVVLSSFLLGGPSGSGVATTVTIGAVAYPMMARAGYEKNAAGGLLAVFYSTFMCFILSGLTEETALGPRPLLMTLMGVTVVALLLLAIPGLRASTVGASFEQYFPLLLLILLAVLAIYGLTPAQRNV